MSGSPATGVITGPSGLGACGSAAGASRSSISESRKYSSMGRLRERCSVWMMLWIIADVPLCATLQLDEGVQPLPPTRLESTDDPTIDDDTSRSGGSGSRVELPAAPPRRSCCCCRRIRSG